MIGNDIIELKINEDKTNRIYKVVQEVCLNYPVILAGGAVRDVCHETAPSDYDIFFQDFTALRDVQNFLESNGFKLIFSCPNAELFTYMKTYDPLVGNRKIEIKVQLICKRKYTDVGDLLESFDFNACLWAIDLKRNVIFTTKKAIIDVNTKVLSINKITYPSSSINRLYKYRNKGYYVGRAIQEIVEEVNRMNFDDLADDTLYID